MSRQTNQPTTPCHVVAMPYPGRGHINPMLNLCMAVADHRHHTNNIHITVVLTEEWLGLIGSTPKPPNVSFAAIPNVVPSERVRGEDVYGFGMAVLTKMEEPFDRLLDELRLPSKPSLIVADAFLPWAAEVAGRRCLPVAYLWPMSAAVYTVFNHVDLLAQHGHFPVDCSVNGDAIVDYIPGLPPSRLADFPTILQDQQNTSFFTGIFPKKSKAKYLIFASIYELEAQIFEYLKKTSPFTIYNIGPATTYFKLKDITNSTNTTHENETNSYLQWLDLQPQDSVLYVSLGSFFSVSMTQMDEIAFGLQKSGVRFLWVARGETSRLQNICGEKGMVVAWCDQLKVLGHPSVGGYWSHCGWSSTKEAALSGVPVLAFPLLIDQLPNAKAMVEDWRIGWRVVKGEVNQDNLAKGNDIGELVKRFMDLESEERKELTKNARELQKICEREFADGSSFQTNLDGFVHSILQHNPNVL